MVPRPGSIPCRIAKGVGGLRRGIHPHRHLSRPPYAWRPRSPGAPCIRRPVRCQRLGQRTGPYRGTFDLIQHDCRTTQPPPHQPLVMISLRCSGRGESTTFRNRGDKSGSRSGDCGFPQLCHPCASRDPRPHQRRFRVGSPAFAGMTLRERGAGGGEQGRRTGSGCVLSARRPGENGAEGFDHLLVGIEQGIALRLDEALHCQHADG